MQDEIIIYNSDDGKTDVRLYSKDGVIWMNQQQMVLLFDTSKQNISLHIANILQEKELKENSVVKDYLTTAADGKNYNVTYYALPMVLAVGFRVRSIRGTQFRIWANKNLTESAKVAVSGAEVARDARVSLEKRGGEAITSKNAKELGTRELPFESTDNKGEMF